MFIWTQLDLQKKFFFYFNWMSLKYEILRELSAIPIVIVNATVSVKLVITA
jgi:hypothetical protein